MTGHVRQRGGSWELRVYAGRDPLTGRPKYATRTVKASGQRAAEKQLAAFVAEVDRDGVPQAGGTFGQLLEQWYDVREVVWSPGNALNTRRRIDSGIFDGLKHLDVRTMTTRDLDLYYAELRRRGGPEGKPLSDATVERIHRIIRPALAQAVKWGWRHDNPAEHATRGADVDGAVTIPPPAPERVVSIIEAAAELDEGTVAFLALAAETGARPAETGALRWTDLLGDRLSISRALTIGPATPENLRRYDEHIWPTRVARGRPTALIEKPRPKTKGSIRTIALSRSTVALLGEYRSFLKARCMAAGVPFDDRSFLFSDEVGGGRPLRPDTWSHRFRRVRDLLGLDTVRLYDLRHYVATSLLAAGVDLTTVAGRLGHGGGGKTTLAIYAHFLEGGAPDRAAAELLSALTMSRPRPDDGGAEVIPLRLA